MQAGDRKLGGMYDQLVVSPIFFVWGVRGSWDCIYLGNWSVWSRRRVSRNIPDCLAARLLYPSVTSFVYLQ